MKDLVIDALNKIQTENPQTITDDVFCIIQSDRKLMERYLEYLAGGNDALGGKNAKIAQMIADLCNLESTDVENKNPKSNLIQQYNEFKRK